MSETPPRRPGGLDWKAVLGIAISALFLYLVFRDVDFAEVWHEIQRAHIGWLLAAGAAATATIYLRAVRWKPLLEPINPNTTFHSRNAATFIGFMANNLLPARVGEFARAYSLSRLERVSISGSFGSLVVERLFDGVTVVLILFVSLTLPGFPETTGTGVDVTGIARAMLLVVAALTGLALLMVIYPIGSVRLVERTIGRVLPEAFRRPLVDAMRAFVSGLEALRSPRLLLRAAVGSILVWGVSVLTFLFGFYAFDIDVPLAAALFLQATIALAVAIPSAPGFFGLFEGAARVGLVNLFGVELSKAIGYAVGVHIIGFIPVTAVGLYYLWRLGLSWRDVGASEDMVETAVEEEQPDVDP